MKKQDLKCKNLNDKTKHEFLYSKNLNFRKSPIETSDLKYFVSFPYFDQQSEKLNSELNKKIQKYFPSIKVHSIFTNISNIV